MECNGIPIGTVIELSLLCYRTISSSSIVMWCTCYPRRQRPRTALQLFHMQVNLVAGALSGVTAVCATYPLDTVRARMALQESGGSAK